MSKQIIVIVCAALVMACSDTMGPAFENAERISNLTPADAYDPCVEAGLCRLDPIEVDGCSEGGCWCDDAMIDSLQSTYRTTFQDTTASRLCGQLQTRFRDLLAQGKVKRGSADIPDGDKEHGAAYYNGIIHIDQNELDNTQSSDAHNRAWARWTMAQMLLHETAHERGFSHGGAETWGAYTSSPFNHVHGNGGAESCVTPFVSPVS